MRKLCVLLEKLARIWRHWQALRCAASNENSWCPVGDPCGEQGLLWASYPQLVINIRAQLTQSPLETKRSAMSCSLRPLREVLSVGTRNGGEKRALSSRMLLTKTLEREPVVHWPLKIQGVDHDGKSLSPVLLVKYDWIATVMVNCAFREGRGMEGLTPYLPQTLPCCNMTSIGWQIPKENTDQHCPILESASFPSYIIKA